MSKAERRDVAAVKSRERESQDLEKLLAHLSTPSAKKQLPALSKSDGKSASSSPKG